MSTFASVRGVRLSPQKGRLVADAIRGLSVEKALDTLRFQTTKGSNIVKNLLESAIANAEHNDGEDIDDLFVEKIFVERGTKLKRFAQNCENFDIKTYLYLGIIDFFTRITFFILSRVLDLF